MKKIEVDVLLDGPSCPFLKLPTRRFPGILVQGDSYFTIASSVAKAKEVLSDGDTKEAGEILEDLNEDLQGMLGLYEDALRANDIRLPYFKR